MIKLKDILKEVHDEELSLDEGLIWTHDITKSVEGLNAELNRRIKNPNIRFEQQDNRILCIIDSEDIDINIIEWIIKSTNNRGWKPAYFTIFGFGTDTKKFTTTTDLISYLNRGNRITIVFEAIRDIQDIELSQFQDAAGYHITPYQRRENIENIGLVPKSQNKMAAHPERIYFAYNMTAIKELFNNDRFYPKINEFAVFIVDMTKLLKDRQIKLFQDPAFSSLGCYTLDNIPKKYISYQGKLTRTIQPIK